MLLLSSTLKKTTYVTPLNALSKNISFASATPHLLLDLSLTTKTRQLRTARCIRFHLYPSPGTMKTTTNRPYSPPAISHIRIVRTPCFIVITSSAHRVERHTYTPSIRFKAIVRLAFTTFRRREGRRARRFQHRGEYLLTG